MFKYNHTFRDIIRKMETKSPYFSPKKTRNFIKKQQHPAGLKATLLQKSTESAGIDNKATCSGTVSAITKLVELTVPQIKLEPAITEITNNKRRQRKQPIKVETSPDRSGTNRSPYFPGERTPVKREPLSPSPQKRTPVKEEPTADEDAKQSKWEPKNWRLTLENIRQMRQMVPAPVDTMGCDQFKDDVNVPVELRRFHTLVSLMLSSQTKDQVNFECMQRLRKHGLTPENVVATEPAVLEKLIYPVSFYKNKAKFIRQASQILITDYGGDIPETIEGLLKLPGVGKKMAHLCMRSAWNVVTGIGVDTHVHRICNWLQWVPKETKTPEDTRVALEKWLPFEQWEEVNQLLVGFGQTICPATYPHCNDCLNADICPAKGKHGIRKTPIKKEKLEF
ncbi:endonuclease III-like protein 1 [Ochlerotatus camptorhynchus]|uniref:endonuclease III-like protein 1 n=1 Tax=Ochlerotatus camptorhynchus TaxID=644619 RepID=UPI0031DA1F1C